MTIYVSLIKHNDYVISKLACKSRNLSQIQSPALKLCLRNLRLHQGTNKTTSKPDHDCSMFCGTWALLSCFHVFQARHTGPYLLLTGMSTPGKIGKSIECFLLVKKTSHYRVRSKLFGNGLMTFPRLMSSNNCSSKMTAEVFPLRHYANIPECFRPANYINVYF